MPDYPELESKAQKIAEELEIDHLWTKISFREVTKEDEDMMQLALNSENTIHGNGDWAVKLGINLFYCANLSRSPLYSKQMPYNPVIYSVFGRNSLVDTDIDVNNSVEYKGSGRQKRSVVAGKWCGKVWMSSQAHPLLVRNDREEQAYESGLLTRIDSMHERESAVKHDTRMATTSTIRTYKRKSIGSNVKMKSLEREISDHSSEGFILSNMHKKIKKGNRGTKRLAKETTPCVKKLDESDEDEESEFSCKRVKNASGAKRMNEEIQQSGSSESDESSEEFPSDNFWKKQGKGERASNPTQKNTPEPHKNKKKIEKKTKSLLEDEDKDGPNTRSRKRTKKSSNEAKPAQTKQQKDMKANKAKPTKVRQSSNASDDETTAEYPCDVEGCIMGFHTKQELIQHKKNICPVKGCGKKFFSHKYLVQHRRVHMDDRPLKCPWKGCKMSFKWAWARTEHIRVHTGARPYICTVSGCGQTFRFVSDFSRHKRKTGHSSKKVRK